MGGEWSEGRGGGARLGGVTGVFIACAGNSFAFVRPTLIPYLISAPFLCNNSLGHISCVCHVQGTAVGTLGLRKRNGLSAISTKPLAQVQVQQVRGGGGGRWGGREVAEECSRREAGADRIGSKCGTGVWRGMSKGFALGEVQGGIRDVWGRGKGAAGGRSSTSPRG